MKTKRSLSGIYFRHQNPETKRWENWCFEDLQEDEQTKILDHYEPSAIKKMVIHLANIINDIGEATGITSEE